MSDFKLHMYFGIAVFQSLEMDSFRGELNSFLISSLSLAWTNTLAYYGVHTLRFRNVF
jgi:hypothetical protein